MESDATLISSCVSAGKCLHMCIAALWALCLKYKNSCPLPTKLPNFHFYFLTNNCRKLFPLYQWSFLERIKPKKSIIWNISLVLKAHFRKQKPFPWLIQGLNWDLKLSMQPFFLILRKTGHLRECLKSTFPTAIQRTVSNNKKRANTAHCTS